MTEAPLAQQLQDMTAAVINARAAMADGAHVEFAGLDGAIVALCSAAERAPHGDREALITALDTLASALDALAQDLTRHEALRLRATNAYRDELGA